MNNTWVTDRTIMLRMTSKRVKEEVDKVLLTTVVHLSRSFWDESVGESDDEDESEESVDEDKPFARKDTTAEKLHFVMRQLTVLTVWCHITTLELRSCVMKEQDEEILAGVLPQCPTVTHLDLSCPPLPMINYNRIKAAGAESLAGVLGKCPALTHLNLHGNGIGDGGVESLAGVLAQ